MDKTEETGDRDGNADVDSRAALADETVLKTCARNDTRESWCNFCSVFPDECLIQRIQHIRIKYRTAYVRIRVNET